MQLTPLSRSIEPSLDPAAVALPERSSTHPAKTSFAPHRATAVAIPGFSPQPNTERAIAATRPPGWIHRHQPGSKSLGLPVLSDEALIGRSRSRLVLAGCVELAR